MTQNKLCKIMIGILLPMILIAVTENWVFTYSGTAYASFDVAYSVIVGADGNIYSAGYTENIGTDIDLTVISLTITGDTNWVYFYNGPGNDQDYAYSITYGLDGNLYVAGSSYEISTHRDFIIISMTPSGNTNWIYRYNGSGNGVDIASQIIYGADDNIYAAGYSTVTGNSYDIAVISLTTAGDTNWTYMYNGSGNGLDRARSLVYGADGNIYIAGGSDGAGTDRDFIVISLTTAGDTNWTYTYNGPYNDYDVANSICYGADGNIYVAGTSMTSNDNYDFTVISLTTMGDTNWTYTYDEPAARHGAAGSIVYGTDGNIYAAGYIDGIGTSYDLAVISLTTSGDTNWIYTYNGPGNFIDAAHQIIYGMDSTLYIVGHIWAADYDATVINLTTAGDIKSIYTYDGAANGSDDASSITCDDNGSIYVAGHTQTTYNDVDFLVISLPWDFGVNEISMIAQDNYLSATILTDALQLPENRTCRVFDITGRVVVHNKIKPGIYFIEADGKITQKVIKIK